MSLSTSDMTRIKRLETRNTLVESIVAFDYNVSTYPNTDGNNGGTGTQLNNGNTRAFVLGCIDPRYASALQDYLKTSLVADDFSYDLFILAGGALGGGLTGTTGACSPGATGRCSVVSTGNNWNEVLKEHIQVGIALHNVTECIVVDHLDCGAYENCIICPGNGQDTDFQRHRSQYTRLTAGTLPTNGLIGISGTTFFSNAGAGVRTGTQIFTSGITGAYFDYRNPATNDTTTDLLKYDGTTVLDTSYFPRDYQTKVLVLGCIDPRYSQLMTSFLNNYKDVQFVYDLFILAGASLGVNQSYTTFPTKRNAGSTGAYPTNQLAVGIANTVAPMGVNWGPTFFDHLSIARLLHQVTEVWVFDHLDCGAYKAIKLGGLPNATDLDPAPHVTELTKLQGFINTYTSTTDYLTNPPAQLEFKGFVMDMDGGITKVVDSGGIQLDNVSFSPLGTFGSSRIRAPTSDIIELRAKASADFVLQSQTQNSPQGFRNQSIRTKLTPTPSVSEVLDPKVVTTKFGNYQKLRLG